MNEYNVYVVCSAIARTTTGKYFVAHTLFTPSPLILFLSLQLHFSLEVRSSHHLDSC